MDKHQAENNISEIQATIYHSKNPVRFYLHNCRKDWLLTQIKKYSSKENTVLEIGIGSGQYSPILAAFNGSLVCFDIENKHLESNKGFISSNNNVTGVFGDITKNSFADNSFDMIVFSEVLEHIDDSEKALQEVSRILKPGGILLLTTPQKYSFVELCGKIAYLPIIIDLLRFVYREPVEKTGHISLYTEKRLQKSLQANDLLVAEKTKMAIYLPLISELGGSLAARLCKKIDKAVRHTPLDVFCWTQCYILEKHHRD